MLNTAEYQIKMEIMKNDVSIPAKVYDDLPTARFFYDLIRSL